MEPKRKEHIDPLNFSKAEFDKLSASEKVDLFVQEYRVPQARTKADTLDAIRRKIDSKTTVETPVRSFRFYWSAAASVALIALLSTVYFYFAPGEKQIVAASKGQHFEYTLPDGSEIKVNADSEIKFSASRFTKKRELELVGEAFFSVQKGKPFVVKTPVGTVEVLGTTLNVFARDKEFNVSCMTGKVKVTVGEQSVTILPGEKVIWDNGTLKKMALPQGESEAGWVKGQFNFDNIPLISIFEEIERQFNVSISAQGIEGRFYTGSFTNNKLAEALEMVCLPMDLDYEIKNGNKISIKPKTH